MVPETYFIRFGKTNKSISDVNRDLKSIGAEIRNEYSGFKTVSADLDKDQADKMKSRGYYIYMSGRVSTPHEMVTQQ